jgi:hypothetical protein
LDAFSDSSSLTATTWGLESTSSTSSMLGDFGQFFALYFPFFLLVFFHDEGWLASDESTANFFLCFFAGASVSLALKSHCHFEDFSLNCFDSLGRGLFKDHVACLELGGVVKVLEMEFAFR